MTKLVPFTTDEKISTAGTAEPQRCQFGRHGELFYKELFQTAFLFLSEMKFTIAMDYF